MTKLDRIVDANLNRVSEGLRSLEDLARFYFEDASLSSRLKALRHQVRKSTGDFTLSFIQSRDSVNDVGYLGSKVLSLDQKADLQDLVLANSKRVQEGLRVIEENFHLLGFYNLAKIYENCRYQAYELEKLLVGLAIRFSKKTACNTDLYCITAEEHSLGRSNIQVVEELIEAGIKTIQYREKDKTKGQKYEECKAIRALTLENGVTFIVNDDVDIALAVKADGVHIGQDDTPIDKVRQIVGEDMIIGLSTHSPAQAQDAIKTGADYIGVGPIFKTATKRDVCAPVGLEYLDYVVNNLTIPFVAIGGIKEHNITEVSQKGANCICLVTEIVGASNISEKIKQLRSLKTKG